MSNQTNRYRVFIYATDAAGRPISPVWYGNAQNQNEAIKKALDEAVENCWTVTKVIGVQMKRKPLAVAA
ncbi:hypothetical protein KGP26_27610 [Serratia sp. JSRIV002]|uniref:hypothetical protein n=1 Tax=Serratia sp. JSRIV002 TaxID=2831894 RepID=UPI001CC0EDE4|nr:hypothetical protein [Serratia sp. JSRIV002]UAN51384.1 hypothetical protein KGP26_27610 [Serratia sp. JSRIV002]